MNEGMTAGMMSGMAAAKTPTQLLQEAIAAALPGATVGAYVVLVEVTIAGARTMRRIPSDGLPTFLERGLVEQRIHDLQ